VAPDFLARMTMPFFCAVPANLPIAKDGVNAPPMAGPYSIQSRIPGKSVTLAKNPHYGGHRVRHLDRIEVSVNTALAASYLQVTSGEADVDLTGVEHPRRPAFKEASVRQAANSAVDRVAVADQAGVEAGTPTDQVLPPGIRGFRDAKLYPSKPDLAKANQLMAGRKFKVNLYTSVGPPTAQQAIVNRQNLSRIGIDVTIKPYNFGVLVQKIGVPSEPYDIALIGWIADYPDPYDFVNISARREEHREGEQRQSRAVRRPVLHRAHGIRRQARGGGTLCHLRSARRRPDARRRAVDPALQPEQPALRLGAGRLLHLPAAHGEHRPRRRLPEVGQAAAQAAQGNATQPQRRLTACSQAVLVS
jgi:ABC-type transport system substrate-binding protein